MPLMLCVSLLFCFGNCSAADTADSACSLVNKVNKYWARELVIKIVQYEHTKLLDFGCRSGEITAELAQKMPSTRVHGIDPDMPMIAPAQDKFAHIKNVRFSPERVPQFFETTAKTPTFSGITSFSGLHWLSPVDLKKTMRGAHQALTDNGRCYFLLAGKRSDGQQDVLTQAVDAVIMQEPWGSDFEKDGVNGLDDSILSFTEEEFSGISQDAGFTIEEVQLKRVEYPFTSSAEFKEWITAVSPYTKLLGTKHELFIDTMLEKYLTLCPAGADGSVSYPDYMLYAILKKQ